MTNIELPIIGTPSRTEQGARCHRRHFVADNLCLVPKTRSEANTALGTMIHAGAAAWWQTGDVAKMHLAWRSAWQAESRWLEAQTDLTKDSVAAIMEHYSAAAKLGAGAWCARQEGWRLEACEKRVVVELSPLARLSFQLDRLAHHAESEVWVLTDTKSKKPGTKYRDAQWDEKWGFSLQQMVYRWVVINVLGVPAAQLEHYIEAVTKAVPSEVRYVQLPAWSKSQLEEAKDALVRLCQKDAKLVADNTLPNGAVDVAGLLTAALTTTDYNPGDCFAFFTKCPLYEVCTSPPELRVGLVRDGFEWRAPQFLE